MFWPAVTSRVPAWPVETARRNRQVHDSSDGPPAGGGPSDVSSRRGSPAPVGRLKRGAGEVDLDVDVVGVGVGAAVAAADDAGILGVVLLPVPDPVLDAHRSGHRG